MRSQRVQHERYSEEVDEMNTEERLARLETKVDHIQSDVTELKADQRQLRDAMQAQGKELRAEMSALRAEMNAFFLGFEKFKWRFWAALVVLFVFQVLMAGGAPAAIARAFRLP